MSLQDKVKQAQAYVAGNKPKIIDKLGQAEQAANRQTGGRYQNQLAAARQKAQQYLDRVQAPRD